MELNDSTIQYGTMNNNIMNNDTAINDTAINDTANNDTLNNDTLNNDTLNNDYEENESDEEYDEEYDEDEIDYIEDYRNKWRYTLYTVIVFIVLANPYSYSFLDSLTKGLLKKSNTNNSPNMLGFVISTIVFTFVIRWMMDLDI